MRKSVVFPTSTVDIPTQAAYLLVGQIFFIFIFIILVLKRQSGCMRPVCLRSSSELQISVRTILKDAATLSWPGLVKQVLPSMDSCWLASADGAVASLSQGEGRTALQTIVLPRICSSSNSSSSSSSGAARSSPCSGAARAARSRSSSLAAHCSSSSNN